MAKRKKRTLRNTLIYLGFLILLSILAYANRQIEHFLADRVATFELRNIRIHGLEVLTRGQVLDLCGLKPGEKLLTIKPSQIARRLLKSPFVKSASAVYSLPATLHITVQERRPLAFVPAKELYLIDEQGVLLPLPRMSGTSWNLPVIHLPNLGHLQVGERVSDPRLRQLVDILRYIRLMPSPLWSMVATIEWRDDRQLQLALIRGGARVRCNLDDYQEELYALGLYVQNYLDWEQLADLEYIDLRFQDRLILKNRHTQG
ncbi:FtsQ-type POTRA domain-containing protein [Candidatus Parcubacteria bacterium]|nr:MAG: FtsQ-type POTRA domain-containing protein [Candidatus Parcubacteria bacterium]